MQNIKRKLERMSQKEYWIQLGVDLKQGLRNLPKILFIRHSHLLDLLAVVIVLIFASYLVVSLLFVPDGVNNQGITKTQLSIDRIERLQQWVQARSEERNRLLVIPDNVFKQN